MTAPRRSPAGGAGFLGNLSGIRIRRLQGLFGAHWQRWYRSRGLAITPVQGGLLVTIRENPGISQIMLARSMRIEAPTLVQSLAPLVRKGLVARRRAADDGRSFELSLSPAGLEAAAIVEAETPLQEADILRGLSGAERRQLLRLLDKAIAGGEEALEAAKDAARLQEEEKR